HEREDRALDELGEGAVAALRDVVGVAAHHDEAAARAVELLEGAGGGEVGGVDGAGVQPGGDQPGDVGDVGEDGRADLVRDRADAVEVHDAGVGRGAADDQLGPVHQGEFAQLRVVDQALLVEAVG